MAENFSSSTHIWSTFLRHLFNCCYVVLPSENFAFFVKAVNQSVRVLQAGATSFAFDKLGKKNTTFCFGKIFELSRTEEFIGNCFVSQLSLIHPSSVNMTCLFCFCFLYFFYIFYGTCVCIDAQIANAPDCWMTSEIYWSSLCSQKYYKNRMSTP